jgi:hypothetical protein
MIGIKDRIIGEKIEKEYYIINPILIIIIYNNLVVKLNN